jgi:hypothetical protein
MSKYIVQIDFTKTLDQMIEQGRFDTANDDIRKENFPTPASLLLNVECEVVLVHMNCHASDAEINEAMKKDGLRPATIVEGLALAAQHKDRQRKFQLAMLGSSWIPREGYQYYVSLDGDENSRNLSLFGGFPVYKWYPHWRFAAVRA